MEVYKAIAEVMAAFSKEGISKSRTNTQGSTYKFRGIDDVLNALSGHLSKANLVIIPRVLSRDCVERQTSRGNAIFYTSVDVEFDLVSAVDASKHTARVQGEAMDVSDKSTNKAMSAAYKYMAFQTFCIPTEGDNDADAATHEVVAVKDDLLDEDPKKTMPKNDAARKEYMGLKENMRLNKTQQDLMRWWKDSDVVAWRLKLSPDWQAALKKEVGEYGDTLPAVEDVVEKIQEVFPGATVKTDTFVEDFVDGK